VSTPFVEARDLRKVYEVRRGLFGRPKPLQAVAGVSFTVPANSTFGLVGESGSGKTTIAKMLMRAELPTGGVVTIDGTDLTRMSDAQREAFPLKVQPVLQDPYSSLSPRMRVEQIIDEPMRVHNLMPNASARRARIAELLEQVGLPAEFVKRYPHELSGGQRQRVAIARALSVNPKCMILDEPVSALDVSVQAQILNLFKELQRRLGLTYLLISHDLAVISFMSDQIGVLYLGQFMELGTRRDIIKGARHPYTQALIAAVDSDTRSGVPVTGEIPSPMNPPSGCPFHTRCPLVQERCRAEKPALRPMGPTQWVACHFAEITRRNP
jgi:oligopeptide/dipeptide ABC transporter ATP-binding protein